MTNAGLTALRAAVAAQEAPWPILRDALLEAGLVDDVAMRNEMKERKKWEWWTEKVPIRKWLGPQGNLMAAIASVGFRLSDNRWYWHIWHGSPGEEERERTLLEAREVASTCKEAQVAAEQYLLEHGA